MYVKYSVLALLFIMFSPFAMAADEEGGPNIGYFKLKPAIVSNLTGGPKYIRTKVELMTEQADRMSEIEIHAPALRHNVLMLIAGSDGKALQTREGKEALRKAALDEIKKTLKQLTGSEIVNDVYFTAFYVK